MARFQLGDAVAVRRDLPWSPQTSYGICRELLAGYEAQGFKVDFQEETPPERITAALKRGDGTRLTARVVLEPGGSGAGLELSLTGTVVVGGAKGMFATESLVRKTALERLESYLAKEIRAQRARLPEDGGRAETIAIEPSEPVEPAVAEASAEDEDGVEVIEDEAAETEPEPAPKPAPAPAAEPAPSEALAPGSVEYRLKVLQIMLERGLIDAEDFSKKKKDILLSL